MSETLKNRIKIVHDEQGKRADIILGCRVEFVPDDLNRKERAAKFLKLIGRNPYCLIQGQILLASRFEGVSLYAQVLEIVADNRLSSCFITYILGDDVYLIEVDELGTPLTETEAIVPQVDLSEHINFNTAEVYSIGNTPFNEIEVLDRSIALSGNGVQPYKFLPEAQAFNVAGLAHPARLRKYYVFGALVVIAAIAAGGWWAYSQKKEKEEAQARAEAVPPPLIAADKCVPQIVAFANYLDANLPYLKHYGATQITFKGGYISVKGKAHRTKHKYFSRDQVARGKDSVPLQTSSSDEQYPKEGRILTTMGMIYDPASNWEIVNYDDMEMAVRPPFGIRNFSDYNVALYHKLSRIGIGVQTVNVSVTEVSPEKKLQIASVRMNGRFVSLKRLDEIASTFLGVPSTCDEIHYVRKFNEDPDTIEIVATIRGRI